MPAPDDAAPDDTVKALTLACLLHLRVDDPENLFAEARARALPHDGGTYWPGSPQEAACQLLHAGNPALAVDGVEWHRPAAPAIARSGAEAVLTFGLPVCARVHDPDAAASALGLAANAGARALADALLARLLSGAGDVNTTGITIEDARAEIE